MASKYSYLNIPDGMNYAIVHLDSGLVYECENYKSAINLRQEVGGVIVNANSTLGVLQIIKARRKWLNIPLPNGNKH